MNERLRHIEKILEGVARAQAQNEIGLAQLKAAQDRTDVQLAKTDAQLAKTDAQLAKTDAKLARIGVQLANIGFSNGDAAEDFFYSSLARHMRLGAVHFDVIERNKRRKKKRLEDEYDIYLENGQAVALIEVKYRVSPAHVECLTTRKIETFRALFPEQAGHKVYTGIAGMSFEPLAESLARDRGVAVLKQKGKRLEAYTETMVAF
jgi:hypothetical protein